MYPSSERVSFQVHLQPDLVLIFVPCLHPNHRLDQKGMFRWRRLPSDLGTFQFSPCDRFFVKAGVTSREIHLTGDKGQHPEAK